MVTPAAPDFRTIPATIPNQIGHLDLPASGGQTFAKLDPATGREVCRVARSTKADIDLAAKRYKLIGEKS